VQATKAAASDFSQLVPAPAAAASASAEKTSSDEKPEWPAPDFKIRNPEGRRELILLIEDENEVAEVAAATLIAEGYKVIVAYDGFTALKTYEKLRAQIGLVILDFFLPVMDGDAVFDELRSLNPDVNVVLSSGFAEQQKVSAMLAQGLRGFVPKPYTRQKLLFQIRSTLDAAKQATAR
jgi:CheY-like chemotaxis protein